MVIEMYECEHCGYRDNNGGYMEEHEKECPMNPNSINNKRLKKWDNDRRLRELTHL